MTDPNLSPAPPKRPHCAHCARPTRVCLCHALPPTPLPTTTTVLILQPSRERHARVKTADLLPLCLANARILPIGARVPPHALLLFPTATSAPLREQRGGAGADTLVLIDGTWASARRALARSPVLRSLRAVTIPEEMLGAPLFKARKPPTHAVAGARSTAEAAAAAIEVLEGSGASGAVAAVRRAVREASEMQIRFIRQKGVGAGRHRTGRKGYHPGLYALEEAVPAQPDVQSLIGGDHEQGVS